MPEARQNVGTDQNFGGVKDSINDLKCSKAGYCGERQISIQEYKSWDALTKKEYTQSGMCSPCQNKFFVEPEECTCVDVGLEVWMRNPTCPEHGDIEYMNGPPEYQITELDFEVNDLED